MFKRPSVQTEGVAVNDKIGTFYAEVKIVADNLEEILVASAGLEITYKYLGAALVPPTIRLDGTPIQDGDYYFETVDGLEGITYYDLASNTWFKIDPVAIDLAATNTLASEQAAATSEAEATSSALAAYNSEQSASNSESAAVNAASAALISEGLAEISATEAALSVQLKTGMSAATFFALAEQRKRDSAGSGFSSWGKPYDNAATVPIQNGLWVRSISYPVANVMMLGSSSSNTGVAFAKAEINGVASTIGFTDHTGIYGSRISYPPAPDGTKTYDTVTGAVVEHVDTTTAFAAETTTNNVITSRKDFVFLESWHEKISDKDVVFPLGNVQYGASAWEGIALSTVWVAQGYSAFGEWDTTTTGRGRKWSTLSTAYKQAFLRDPENNIYLEDGELIQVRYRIRVIEGRGDIWSELMPTLYYKNAFSDEALHHVRAQGTSTIPQGWANSANAGYSFRTVDGENGLVGTFLAGGAKTNVSAIPIALVQRRNSGAFSPIWNPQGVTKLYNSAKTSSKFWYEGDTPQATSIADCFNTEFTIHQGNISANKSGRPDGKFYDAIYTSDVQDLRMSSRKLPLAEIREKYKRMAISGEVRGFETVPFTKPELFTRSNSGYSGNSTWVYSSIENLTKNAGDIAYSFKGYIVGLSGKVYKVSSVSEQGGQSLVYLQSHYGNAASDFASGDFVLLNMFEQSHKQANPTWTDIIGSPANIAATFPDGAEGQWIPSDYSDGLGNQILPLNRKFVDSLSREYLSTVGNYTNWSADNVPDPTETNVITTGIGDGTSFGGVGLYHYETQAHFTQDDVNSEVLDLGGDWCSNGFLISWGGLLISSLLGKVSTSDSIGSFRSGSGVYNHCYTAGKLNTHYRQLPIGVNVITPYYGAGLSPAVKTLDYLSQENNVAKLNYAYKEMVYDVDWGDNNQFSIRNNQGTMLDDNGNTVLYGTASFNTQFFTVDS